MIWLIILILVVASFLVLLFSDVNFSDGFVVLYVISFLFSAFLTAVELSIGMEENSRYVESKTGCMELNYYCESFVENNKSMLYKKESLLYYFLGSSYLIPDSIYEDREYIEENIIPKIKKELR